MPQLLCAALIAWLTFAAVPSPAAETKACGKGGYPHDDGSACTGAAGDSYCTDLESCNRLCCCACKFDPSNWNQDGACANFPASTSPMLISRETTQTITAPTNVTVAAGVRGLPSVVTGLTAVGALLPTIRARYPQYGNFGVKVHSCWRSSQADSEQVCAMVIRKLHVEQNATWPMEDTGGQQGKNTWRENARKVWMKTWPGGNPHSGGFACDMVLTDANGNDCFGVKATDPPTEPRCASIDQRTASSIMDEIMTDASVGAVRLDFEAWHYEWNSPLANNCRCNSKAQCATRIANGDPANCGARR